MITHTHAYTFVTHVQSTSAETPNRIKTFKHAWLHIQTQTHAYTHTQAYKNISGIHYLPWQNTDYTLQKR